jgi:hypothetical protein
MLSSPRFKPAIALLLCTPAHITGMLAQNVWPLFRNGFFGPSFALEFKK